MPGSMQASYSRFGVPEESVNPLLPQLHPSALVSKLGVVKSALLPLVWWSMNSESQVRGESKEGDFTHPERAGHPALS